MYVVQKRDSMAAVVEMLMTDGGRDRGVDGRRDDREGYKEESTRTVEWKNENGFGLQCVTAGRCTLG